MNALELSHEQEMAVLALLDYSRSSYPAGATAEALMGLHQRLAERVDERAPMHSPSEPARCVSCGGLVNAPQPSGADLFANRLDAFVTASREYTDACSVGEARAHAAARTLASAGDRLESALREMIRAEAEKLLAERFH